MNKICIKIQNIDYEYAWVDLVNPWFFGNYLGDGEILQDFYYHYAIANTHPDLELVANLETLSNYEGGVSFVLEEY